MNSHYLQKVTSIITKNLENHTNERILIPSQILAELKQTYEGDEPEKSSTTDHRVVFENKIMIAINPPSSPTWYFSNESFVKHLYEILYDKLNYINPNEHQKDPNQLANLFNRSSLWHKHVDSNSEAKTPQVEQYFIENKHTYDGIPNFVALISAFFSAFPEHQSILKDFPILATKIDTAFSWLNNSIPEYVNHLIEKYKGYRGDDTPLLYLSLMTKFQRKQFASAFLFRKFQTEHLSKLGRSTGPALASVCEFNEQQQIFNELLNVKINYNNSINKFYIDVIANTFVELFLHCEQLRPAITEHLFKLAELEISQYQASQKDPLYNHRTFALIALAKLYQKLPTKELLFKCLVDMLDSKNIKNNLTTPYPALEAAYHLMPHIDDEDKEYFITKLLLLPNTHGKLKLLQLYFPLLPKHQEKLMEMIFDNYLIAPVKDSFLIQYYSTMTAEIEHQFIEINCNRAKKHCSTLLSYTLCDIYKNTKYVKYKDKILETIINYAIKNDFDTCQRLIESIQSPSEPEKEATLHRLISRLDKVKQENDKKVGFVSYYTTVNEREVEVNLNYIINYLKHGSIKERFEKLIPTDKHNLIKDEDFATISKSMHRYDSVPYTLFAFVSEKVQMNMIDRIVSTPNYPDAFAAACHFYSHGNEKQQNFLVEKLGLCLDQMKEGDEMIANEAFRYMSLEHHIIVHRILMNKAYSSEKSPYIAISFLEDVEMEKNLAKHSQLKSVSFNMS